MLGNNEKQNELEWKEPSISAALRGEYENREKMSKFYFFGCYYQFSSWLFRKILFALSLENWFLMYMEIGLPWAYLWIIADHSILLVSIALHM